MPLPTFSHLTSCMVPTSKVHFFVRLTSKTLSSSKKTAQTSTGSHKNTWGPQPVNTGWVLIFCHALWGSENLLVLQAWVRKQEQHILSISWSPGKGGIKWSRTMRGDPMEESERPQRIGWNLVAIIWEKSPHWDSVDVGGTVVLTHLRIFISFFLERGKSCPKLRTCQTLALIMLWSLQMLTISAGKCMETGLLR